MSDLHLGMNKDLEIDVDRDEVDVLVIAGDISNGAENAIYELTELGASMPWTEILYVPGNHDFYGYEIKEAMRLLNSARLPSNVRILQNSAHRIGDVAFFGSTFWTAFDLPSVESVDTRYLAASRSLADFWNIRTSQGLLTPRETVEFNKEARQELLDFKYRVPDLKKVVITHHSPTQLSIDPRFEGSILNDCFHSKGSKEDFEGVDVWIHGHTHSSFDYLWNETRVVCNPYGYGDENEDGFEPNKVIVV